MILAFVIWSLTAVVFVVLGISTRKSEKAANFWANAKAPEVSDIKKYNSAVSTIWFVFAVLFELLGIPLLYCQQNSPVVLLPLLGTVILIIGIMIAYTRVEAKYRK